MYQPAASGPAVSEPLRVDGDLVTLTDNDGNNRERYEVIANQVTYLDSPTSE